MGQGNTVTDRGTNKDSYTATDSTKKALKDLISKAAFQKVFRKNGKTELRAVAEGQIEKRKKTE